MILNKRLIQEFKEDCVEWDGAMHVNGYGCISINRKVAEQLHISRSQHVHRASYIQHKGLICDGLVVRHLCNNKKCYNPNHLISGTQLDNFEDSIKAGTSVRKLSNSEVSEIRVSCLSNRKLSIIYKVSPTTIFHIKNNNKWRNYGG